LHVLGEPVDIKANNQVASAQVRFSFDPGADLPPGLAGFAAPTVAKVGIMVLNERLRIWWPLPTDPPLRQLGVPAHRTLDVGDGGGGELRGALMAGMAALAARSRGPADALALGTNWPGPILSQVWMCSLRRLVPPKLLIATHKYVD